MRDVYVHTCGGARMFPMGEEDKVLKNTVVGMTTAMVSVDRAVHIQNAWRAETSGSSGVGSFPSFWLQLAHSRLLSGIARIEAHHDHGPVCG